MGCFHRFLGIHKPNSLLPNWCFNTLIVGTFNPHWNFSKGEIATYFYGRTRNNYFWDVLPEIHNKEKLRKAGKEEWIDFLKKEKIGLTDLLLNIKDAQEINKIHWEYLRTKADINLAKFKELQWNTSEIIKLIDTEEIKSVYITNISSPPIFEAQVEKINEALSKKGFAVKRLVTPSKMCRFYFKNRNGKKLYECLLEKWKDEFKK